MTRAQVAKMLVRARNWPLRVSLPSSFAMWPGPLGHTYIQVAMSVESSPAMAMGASSLTLLPRGHSLQSPSFTRLIHREPSVHKEHKV